MIDKQQKHNEVIRLYFEEGWSEERIGREVGVGHTTVNRWVAAYAKSQGKDKRDLRAEMGGTKSERVSAHEAERDKLLRHLTRKLHRARQQVVMLENLIRTLKEEGTV